MNWLSRRFGYVREDEQVRIKKLIDLQSNESGWLVLVGNKVLGWREDLDKAKLLGEAWPEGLEEFVPDGGKWEGPLT